MDSTLMTVEEFPHGLRCADCDREIEPGQRFSTRLTGMMDDVPVTVVTCVPCGFTERDEEG